MDELKKKIGYKLKERRKYLKLTIKEVVSFLSNKGINISEKTLYSWESCHRQPDADTFMILCRIYKIEDTISYFMDDSRVSKSLIITDKEEQDLIKKYRALDERGKNAVNAVMNASLGHGASKNQEDAG